MVLLLAAILKIGDIRSEGWADNAGTFTIAMGEVALAGWLLSGRRPAFAWVATIITFAVFALVAASKAAAGESSCGCFGQVRAD
ncbi:MAG TPA: MauE/DoxX family redox-associated membrane protein, partial [Tepidisphaeraceae bacterium]|nr:MauE/DoxX family redox-associated membrane protein [Tepidisphaeraceae bacterium]